jgi:hypothetical protein
MSCPPSAPATVPTTASTASATVTQIGTCAPLTRRNLTGRITVTGARSLEREARGRSAPRPSPSWRLVISRILGRLPHAITR